MCLESKQRPGTCNPRPGEYYSSDIVPEWLNFVYNDPCQLYPISHSERPRETGAAPCAAGSSGNHRDRLYDIGLREVAS